MRLYHCTLRGVLRLPLGLPLILRVVVGQAVQDEDLAPLGALVEGRQQLVDILGVQVQQVAVGVRLADLRQSRHGVGNDLRVGGEHGRPNEEPVAAMLQQSNEDEDNKAAGIVFSHINALLPPRHLHFSDLKQK